MNTHLHLGDTPDEEYRALQTNSASHEPQSNAAAAPHDSIETGPMPDAGFDDARRPRRSQHSKRENLSRPSPLAPHTLDSDMPDIVTYAAMFAKLDPYAKQVASKYVFDGQSIAWYHGMYVAYMHMYIMSTQSGIKDIVPALTYVLYAVSHKIVLTKDLKPVPK